MSRHSYHDILGIFKHHLAHSEEKALNEVYATGQAAGVAEAREQLDAHGAQKFQEGHAAATDAASARLQAEYERGYNDAMDQAANQRQALEAQLAAADKAAADKAAASARGNNKQKGKTDESQDPPQAAASQVGTAASSQDAAASPLTPAPEQAST